MGSFDDFNHYIPPTPRERQEAIESGLVVLDTNVLLSAYRYEQNGREQLLNTLRDLGNRIWIPYQVAKEFHNRRLEVMQDYASSYNELLKAIDGTREKLESSISEFAHRTNISGDDHGRLTQTAPSFESVRALVETLRERHGIIDENSADPVYEQLKEIFAGRIGPAFTRAEEDEATKEAEDRRIRKIPPGYEDAKKEDSRGDYFVWRQTLLHLEGQDRKYLVFVTDDAKPDWQWRIKGKFISARPELIAEANAVGARLVLMTVRTFLLHAKDYLAAVISAETLRQAEDNGLRTLKETTRATQDSIASLTESYHRSMEHSQNLASEVAEMERRLGNAHEQMREAPDAEPRWQVEELRIELQRLRIALDESIQHDYELSVALTAAREKHRVVHEELLSLEHSRKAADYERAVFDAIRRAFPRATVRHEPSIDASVSLPDQTPDRCVFVDIRRRHLRPLSTLDIGNFRQRVHGRQGARLLVTNDRITPAVANSARDNAAPITVVTWRDENDDASLRLAFDDAFLQFGDLEGTRSASTDMGSP